MNHKTISGAAMKLHFQEFINNLKDEDEIFFGAGDLSLYGLKERGPVEGPRLVQVKFNEVYSVTVDPDKL